MPIYTKGDVKVLHVHTPKTGGTSIMKLFSDDGYKIDFYSTKNRNPCPPQHYHYDMYKNIFDLDQFDYIFSTYRDPVSRFHSQYRYWTQIDNKDKPTPPYTQWASKAFRDYKTNKFCQDNHIRPQNEFYFPDMDVYIFSDLKNIPKKLHSKGVLSKVYHMKHKLKTRKTKINHNLNEQIKNFYNSDYDWFTSNRNKIK